MVSVLLSWRSLYESVFYFNKDRCEPSSSRWTSRSLQKTAGVFQSNPRAVLRPVTFCSFLFNRSIGVLIYVMLTGESPFLGDDKQETFLNISQVNIDYSQDTFEGISSLAVDFIKSLLVKNPRWVCLSETSWFDQIFQRWLNRRRFLTCNFGLICTKRMCVTLTQKYICICLNESTR